MPWINKQSSGRGKKIPQYTAIDIFSGLGHGFFKLPSEPL